MLVIVQVRYDEELKVYLKLTGLRSSDVAKMKAKKSRPTPSRRPAAPPPYSEMPQTVVQQPVVQQQPPQYLHHQQQLPQQRQQVPQAAASSAAGSSGMQQSLHQQQQQQQQLQATNSFMCTVDRIIYTTSAICVICGLAFRVAFIQFDYRCSVKCLDFLRTVTFSCN